MFRSRIWWLGTHGMMEGGREAGEGESSSIHRESCSLISLSFPLFKFFGPALLCCEKDTVSQYPNKSTVSSNSYATLTLVTFLSLEVMPNTSVNQLYLLYRWDTIYLWSHISLEKYSSWDNTWHTRTWSTVTFAGEKHHWNSSVHDCISSITSTYLHNKQQNPSIPTSLQSNTSSRCKLRCVGCLVPHMGTQKVLYQKLAT